MSERLQVVIGQFERMRRYTVMVLDHTDPARWYELPPSCPTHMGWELGHIAWAQALHALKNVGQQPTTDPLPESWGTLFGKTSVAVADPKMYPSTDDLLAMFQATHERTMQVLRKLPDAALDEPTSHMTGLVRHKLDLLYFLMRHESIHTGQIALMRRLFGAAPYR
jgi:hypothetical protein